MNMELAGLITTDPNLQKLRAFPLDDLEVALQNELDPTCRAEAQSRGG